MLSLRTVSLVACFVLLFSESGAPKEPWEDSDWGTMDSAKLLFHPPQRIEFRHGEVRFLAREFTYVYFPGSDRWTVTRTQNEMKPIEGWGTPGNWHESISTSKGLLRFGPPERGILEVNFDPCTQPIGRLELWTREQLSRAWLTVRFYAGEGYVGMGTIVEINKSTCAARIIQPPQSALYSISQVVRACSSLWLATEDFGESGTGPGVGLARYDLQTGGVELLRTKHPSLGSHITDLAREGKSLWIATIDGFGVLDLGNQVLQSWRIAPIIDLTKPASVSSLPGGPTRNKIGAGHYEVRWVGQGLAEILTPDCAEGFEEVSTYKWHASRSFESSAMAVATGTQWGISGLVLYPAPQGRRPEGRPTGWFLRALAEPIGKPENGWQHLTVCAGWVELSAGKIQMTIIPE
jgi:hypothetical protein